MNSIVKISGHILKMIFDYLVTFLCLIFLIPVIVILTLYFNLTGNGPVLYSQKRVGRDGKPFVNDKFRTQHIKNEEGIPLISGREDKRITALGRFMRKH